MDNQDFLILTGVFAILVLLSLFVFYILLQKLMKERTQDEVKFRELMRNEWVQQDRGARNELQSNLQNNFTSFSQLISQGQKQINDSTDKRLSELNEQYRQRNEDLHQQISLFVLQTQQQLQDLQRNVQDQVQSMRKENQQQLELIRHTVDEKLQKTLEERIGQSFQLVSTRLEEVYKGLGEMQSLASGVGDLKRVLTNVKTRGMLGELQLAAILEQILAPEQYASNVQVYPNASERVEFAIKLPGDGQEEIWLPIDSKFPVETYQLLLTAYENGAADQVQLIGKEFEKEIRSFAKLIHDKYIRVPYTTGFALMFLPIEGLYAEIVRRGMIESLQGDYQINIAGPTTMAAFLNSIQMGFRTLAIQKQSGEVWKTLGNVKAEFEKFSDVLGATQRRLDQARDELDKLVGVRTRAIRSRLREVESLPEDAKKSLTLLQATEPTEDEPE
jgi:DNA recombination protein RmuC